MLLDVSLQYGGCITSTMYHLNTPTALLERSDVPINRAVTGHLEGIQTFKKSQGIQLRFKSSENNPTPGNPIDD